MSYAGSVVRQLVSFLLVFLAAFAESQGPQADYWLYLPSVARGGNKTLMATYYVKTDGNDGLDGLSWPNAWLTVNKAATTATGGDTVLYANGTYDLGAGQSTWNSGTSGNIITHQADSRRLAIWEQSDTGNTVELDTDSYIIFQELIIRGDNVHTQTGSVRMDDCDHLTFDDCELGESTEARFGFYVRSCHTIRIDLCMVHPNNAGAPVSEDGINIHYDCANIAIVDTEFYDCGHAGIDINTCDGLLIDNCHIHRTGSHGISIGDSYDTEYVLDDITVCDCRVHDNDTTYNHAGTTHNNIRIHLNASNVTLLRNDLYNAACCGIYISCEATGPITLYNNTLYNHGLDQPTYAAVFFDGSQSPDNLAANINYKNNIVYVTQTDFKALYASSSLESHVQADYNLYYSSSDTKEIRRNGTTYTTFQDYLDAGFEPNAVIDDDPDLTDAANADFTLQAGSPAIDQGVDIGQSYRGPAPDIGAHEYGPKTVICMIM